MTQDLRHLIHEIISKEEVGTLFLGKGNRLRHVFFSGNGVHLVEIGKQCRFVPAPELIEAGHLAQEVYHQLVEEVRGFPQSLGVIMQSRQLVPAEPLAEYLQREELEEVWLLLTKNRNRFCFEEGSVPEELLLTEASEREEIPNMRFIEFYDQRESELEDFARTLPSGEEVMIVSEKGLSVKNAGEDWVFSQVAELSDGFRTVAQTLRDSPFFPHLTTKMLVAAARNGLFRKTVFPELQGIVLNKLAPSEINELIPRFEEGIVMAVDELPLLRALATLCAKSGDPGRAIGHLNQIGDLQLRRREHARALATYQEALQLDPESPFIRQKVHDVFLHFADDAFDRNDKDEGRKLLEEAVRLRPSELEGYLRVTSSYATEEAVLRATPRLLKLMGLQEEELTNRFFRSLLERFPDSVGLRKRFVNHLLDRGRREDAIQELRYLAGNLLDRGLAEEARSVYRKLAKLDPTLKLDARTIAALGKESVGLRTRRRPSKALWAVAVILLTFGAYQFVVYGQFEDLNRKVYALAQQPMPNLGSDEYREMQAQASDVLDEYNGFRRRHFLSVWSAAGQRSVKTLESRLAFMENRTHTDMNRLVDQAKEAELRGRFVEARAIYEEVIQKAEGTKWAEKASRRLQGLELYVSGSSDLFEQGQRACANGNYALAFQLYSSLLIKYPRSQEALEVRLPIRLESSPSGALVRSGKEVLGTTPTVVWSDTISALELRLSHPGYRTRTVVVRDPTGYELLVELEPRD